jgi:hypothetical protein
MSGPQRGTDLQTEEWGTERLDTRFRGYDREGMEVTRHGSTSPSIPNRLSQFSLTFTLYSIDSSIKQTDVEKEDVVKKTDMIVGFHANMNIVTK